MRGKNTSLVFLSKFSFLNSLPLPQALKYVILYLKVAKNLVICKETWLLYSSIALGKAAQYVTLIHCPGGPWYH